MLGCTQRNSYLIHTMEVLLENYCYFSSRTAGRSYSDSRHPAPDGASREMPEVP
ncbi:MAG TPA: hypothetical protein PLV72_04370 [Candidatus Magasanikbacteria bacterium]|nr:hypothetical protein [Candidatus Magasanikbacteria bacterium]